MSESDLKWFTVVKIPFLKIALGDQRLLYSVTGRVGFRAYLTYPCPYRDFVDKVLEIMRAREHVVETIDEAALFDYLSATELPVDARIAHAYYAFEFQWVKKTIPIKFVIHLKDRLWRKEREIKADAELETYSKKASVVIPPQRFSWAMAYDEEVTIDGRVFRRVHGMFTTERSPFIDTSLEATLKDIAPGMPYLPVKPETARRARRRRLILPSHGYDADLLDLLKLIQRGLKVAPRPRAGYRALAASLAAPTPAIPTPRPGRE
jgi:hypothetical protein